MRKLITSLAFCLLFAYHVQAQLSISASSTGVSCAGVCDGTVSLTISGSTGGGPFDIYMTDGAGAEYTDTTALTTVTYTGICKANPLTVLVTDLGNGDITSTTVVVSGPSAILLGSAPSSPNTPVTCKDSCNGRIRTRFTGDGPLTYLWSNGTSGTFNSGQIIANPNLCADTYSVVITDNWGCTQAFTYLQASYYIVAEPNYVVSSFSITNSTCNGTCDGIVSAATTGGNGGYLYNWNGTPSGDGTNTITNLCDGQYILTVTDNKGCIGIDTATVIEPTGLVITPTVDPVDCNGGSNGSISLAVSGGISPYTYQWSPGVSTTNTASSLFADSYEIIVTDNNGLGSCPDTIDVVVTEPTAISANSGSFNVLCYGASTGSAWVAPTGGAGGYTYLWNTGSTNDTLYNVAAGTYTVTITDISLCTQTASVTITENTQIQSNLISADVSCHGLGDGSASVSPTGGATPAGYTVLWSNGAITDAINSLSGGTYIVTITDDLGCSLQDTAIIIDPAAFSINLVVNNVSCNGLADGSATVSPSGGTAPHNTTWYNPIAFDFDTAISNLTPGSYTVSVVDGAGCSVTNNFTITQPSAINPNISHTNNTCFSNCLASASSSPTGGNGGYLYDWSTGGSSNSITNLCAGSYTLTVTDSRSCTGTQTIAVTEPDSIELSLIKTDATCGACDGDATTTPIGGSGSLDILWETGSTSSTISSLCIGYYSITVTDDNGCSNTDSIEIETPGNITLNEFQTNVTCAGASDGVAGVAPTGGIPGYIYNWSTGATTPSISGLTPGNYTVTVSDAQPCVLTQSFTITSNTPMTLTPVQDSASCANICDGGGAVNINGGTAPYSFLWSNGSTDSLQLNLCIGSYNVTVTDNNGCTSSNTLTIDPKIVIAFGISVVKKDCNDLFCDGQASGTASGGVPAYSFAWSDGIPSIVGPTTGFTDSVCVGMVYITVTDQNGCTGVDSVYMPADTNVMQVQMDVDSISCSGANDGALSAIASGGPSPYTYLWNTGATTSSITNLSPGTYSVTVTDTNLCRVDTSFVLTNPSALNVSALGTNITCQGAGNGQINATVSGGTTAYSYLWSSGQTTEDISGLNPGSYTLTVTDYHGCTNQADVTITEPLVLSNTFSSISTSCQGICDAQSTSTPTGGTSPYTYQWDINTLFQTTDVATNLCAGEYFITITDANLCTKIDSITIAEPLALSISMSNSAITCYGDADGNATASPSGGTSPYDYMWSINTGSQTTQTANNLGDGTYDVTVTDQNNCTATSSITITQPDSISVNLVVNHISCYGSGNGSIDASSSIGGTGALSYQWDLSAGSQTSSTASNLDPGTYSVTITDQNSCSNSGSATIASPQPLQGSPSATDANCNLNDGTARVFPLIGGVPPYQHHWSTGQTTSLITGLAGGIIYSDTITDALGCQLVVDVPVSEVGGPTSVSIISSQISCYGFCDGTALSSGVMGGTSPYTYLWNDPSATTDSLVSNLCEGSYLLMITDAIGCSYFSPAITISQPDSLEANTYVIDASCVGLNNGEISSNPQGGTAPYNYSWSNGDNTNTITGLTTGTYGLTITDINGCTVSENTLFVDDASSLVVNLSGVDVLCQGDSTGSATIAAIGGGSPYTYQWDYAADFQTSSTANDLIAGTYYVTLTDNNGCTVDTFVTISENSALDLSASVTHTLCGQNTGDISVTPMGGTGPYSLLWLHDGNTSASIFSLTAGIYSVVVTDQSLCSDTFSIVVNNSDGPIITSTINNTTCYAGSDGSAQVNVTGGVAPYTYSWSPTLNTDAFINNVSAGTYYVQVTDLQGCYSLDTVIISEPLEIQLDFTTTNPSCFGSSDGQILADASFGVAPIQYNWSNGVNGAFNSGLATGTFLITATDANGCSSSSTVGLTDPGIISVSELVQDASCFGSINGQAILTTSGGHAPYQYAWSHGVMSASASGLMAGQYDYTVTDAMGCTYVDSILISEPSAISIVSNTTNTNCGMCIGSITNIVSGGSSPYFYAWSSGGGVTASVNGLCAGIYDLTVTDVNGCALISSFNISNTDGPQIMVENDTLDCYAGSNGSLTAIVSGGVSPYTYVWNDPALQTTANASNLNSGTYQVLVTDQASCPNIASAVVVTPSDLILTQTVVDPDCNTLCDVTASAGVSGGSSPYNFIWSDGQTGASATGLCAGTYVVTVTDQNTCSKTMLVSVEDASDLSLAIDYNDITCHDDNDGEAFVSATGGAPGYIFSWSNGFSNPYVSSLSAGTYTVSVTDQEGCIKTQTISINNPDVLSAVLNAQDLLCFGIPNGSANAIISGGTGAYQYNWYSSGSTNTSASSLSAGYQYITVTDQNGCLLRDSVLLNQPDEIVLNTSQVEPNCNATNGSIIITPSGGVAPYLYVWAVIGQTDSIADNIGAGNYSVSVDDQNGCRITQTISLSNLDGPSVSLQTEDVSCGSTNDGQIIATVSGGSLPYIYNWSNGGGNDTASSLVAGIYSVTVTDGTGCISIASDTVFNSVGLDVLVSITDVSCNNPNDGSIALSVTGGTSPYNYVWGSLPDVTPAVSSLFPGTYHVTVTDQGICNYIDSFVVSQATPIFLSANISNNQCNGDLTGNIAVTASGGVPGYSYTWSNGDADATLNGVSAGTYTITITDQAACSFDSTFTLIEPTAIQNTFIYTEATCNQSDGAIQTSVSGGTGTTYTYLWAGGAAAGQTTSSVNTLPAGLYQVTITDSLGCSFSFNAGLSNINAPDVVLDLTHESCLGTSNGTATVAISGGTPPYEVLWSTGDTTLSIDSMASGEFSVIVTDAIGCITIMIDTINAGSDLVVGVDVLNISCVGGSSGQITLTPTGGVEPYTYNWAPIANNTSLASNLALGMYYFTVTDQNGCSLNDSAEVENASPMFVSALVDSIKCAGNTGAIDIVVSGGNSPYTYSWSNGSSSQNITGLNPGTYLLTITDATLCTFDTFIVIDAADTLMIDYALTTPTCNNNDGAILASVSGGLAPYSLTWGGQALGQTGATASNLYADVYPVTVTDQNACIKADSVALSNDTGPVVSLDSLKDVTCFGYEDGYIFITATSVDVPLVYEWSSGETTDDITNIGGGGYVVTVTDTVGCKTIVIYEIAEPDSFYVVLSGINPTCHGLCNGQASAAFFGGTNPYSFLWNDPLAQTNDTAISLCDGAYEVLVTDDHLCTTTAQISLVEPDTMLANIDFVQNAVCSQSNEGIISLSVSGGSGTSYTYAWTGPNGYSSNLEDINNLFPGTYAVSITDSLACQVNLDTVINSTITVSIDSILASDTAICLNEVPVSLTGYWSGFNLSFEWSYNGTVIANDSVASVSPGVGIHTYVLEVSYSGCQDVDSVQISVEEAPVVDAGVASPIIDGLCRTIGGSPTGPSGATYLWGPDYELNGATTANPEVCPDQTTIYFVTVTSINGCQATDSVEVLVFPEISFIPGFSNNGDGNNDVWVINNLQDFPDVVVEVYNRWGQKLWESEPGYPTPWDGTFKGNKLPVGTYYYVINLNRPEFPEPITGPITIVR